MPSNISKTLAFIGDGEGKTSAAIGHAVRAAGHGKKVAVIQFLKGMDNIGEYKLLQNSKNSDGLIEMYLAGDRTFLMPGDDKTKHSAKAKEGIKLAKELINSGKFFLVVLDEVLDAMAAGLILMDDIRSLLSAPSKPHIIITGRTLPSELSHYVDLITRLQKIKHYYDKDEKGIEGLDW